MAIRGENIGTAYIRILASGDGFDRSVRDQFEDIDWDSLGRKGSQEWQKGFQDEQEKAPNRNAFRDSVVGPLIRGKWLSEEFFGGKNWTTFENDLNKHFGAAGVLAREGLEKELMEGLTLEQLGKRLENMQRDVLRAQETINSAHNQAIVEDERRTADQIMGIRLDRDRDFEQHALNLHEDFLRETFERDKAFEDRAAQLHADAMKQREDRDREFMADHARLAAQALADEEAAQKQRLDLDRKFDVRHAESVRKHLAQIAQERIDLAALKDTYSLYNRETKQMISGDAGSTKSKKDLLDMAEQLRVEMGRLNFVNLTWSDTIEDTDRQIRKLHPNFRKVNTRIDTFADSMGKAFGHGARNDVVNLVGSMVRGVFRLPRLFTSLAESMLSVEGRAKLLRGAVAGIGGAFVFVGPIISMLSLAGGAITALASTAAMAAAGGIGALGGTAIVAAGAIATLTLAFTHATPEMKKAGKTIKDTVNDLGDLAAEHTFANVTRDAGRFNAIIDKTQPIISGIGDALSRVQDYWLDLMEEKPGQRGNAFDNFIDTASRRLPNMVESLGDTIGNILVSLGGLFRGVAPITGQFLNWLQQGSREFKNWANSKQGIADIRSFMDDAADSASELGGFLAAVSDLLGTIISSGNEAGDSLFDSMTKTLKGWDDALEADPSILKDWFDSAASFGRAVGRVVVNLGELADVLDNTFSRNIAVGAINAISGALKVITAPLRLVANLFGQGENKALAFGGQLAGMALVMRSFGGKFSTAATSVGGFVTDMRNAETRMGRFKQAARGAAGVGGLVALTVAAGETDKKVRTLETALGGAMLGFQVGGPWGAAIGAGAGALLGMSDAFGTASDSAAQLKDSQDLVKDSAQELRQTLNQVSGAATAETRALTANRLQQDGVIESAGRLGISSRDLVSAALGNERAQNRVNEAYANGKKRMNDLIESGHPMSRGFGQLTKDMDNVKGSVGFLNAEYDKQRHKQEEVADATQTWSQALKGVPKKVHSDIRALGADASIDDVAQLVAQYDLTPKQVRTTIDAIGANFSARQVQNLNKNFKALPKKVETRLDALNWDTTAGQIAGLRHEYDLTPKQVRTIIKAEGLAKTDKDVRALVDKILDLDKKEANPKSDLDTKGFENGKRQIDGWIKDITGKKPTPKADLDTGPLKDGKTVADGLLRALDGERPTPKADLDAAGFNNILSNVNSALNIFDGKSVAANANVNVNRQALDDLIGDLGNLDTSKTITITTEHISTYSGKVPRTSAAGMLTSSPQLSWIGEAGPEAVVPLNRPLSMVDPAVRELSAFAQGKKMASGGVAGGGKTYNVNQYITTPNSDARAVASETVNRLVAVGY